MKYALILISILSISCSKDQSSSLQTAQSVWWNGPKAALIQDLQININGSVYKPFFLSINPQAISAESDWDNLLYQLDLAIAHHMVIVDIMFANNSSDFMKLLAEKLGDRKVFVIAKFYFGTSSDAITDEWISDKSDELSHIIKDLNQYLPNKVIGIRPMALESGEWFKVPANVAMAKQISKAQIALAHVIKTMTSENCLVGMYAGYLFAFASIEGGAHVDFQSILESTEIDIIASPYSYNESRDLNNPITHQVPIDSVRLHGKLFLTEDDTRTSFSDPSFGQHSCDTLACDKGILNRNIKSALSHGHGLYFLDLPAKGWFGRLDRQTDSIALWDAIEASINQQVSFTAQISVFVDAETMKQTPAGIYVYNSVESQMISLEQSGLGVKYYMLSDKSLVQSTAQTVGIH